MYSEQLLCQTFHGLSKSRLPVAEFTGFHCSILYVSVRIDKIFQVMPGGASRQSSACRK